jgi:hypothetical protein
LPLNKQRKKAVKVFPPKWERYWPWAALCILFLVYRLVWINGTGLWLDEGNSVGVSRSLSSAMRDRNGAAYFVLLFVWKTLFWGSEFALRSLSVAVDAVSFVLFIFICQQMALSRRQTFLAAFLYIVIPPNVVNAQNVRQYVLWNLLQMALWATIWRATTPLVKPKTEAVLVWALCQVFYFLSLETHRYTGVYALGLVLAAGVRTKWNKKLIALFVPWIPLTILSSRLFTERPVSLDFALEASAPLYREWGPLFPLGALIVDPRWNYLLTHPGFHGAVGALAFAVWAFGIRHHYRKGHAKESVWLLCLLLPLFVLALLPLRSYPRLLQPMVSVFCIGFAIAFVSWLEAQSAAVRRSALVLGLIVAAVFLQTGYKIKRVVLQDFRAAVGNLVDTQPPDALMITVPSYAYAAARYYAGEHRLLMGFSGTPEDTLSLAGTLAAFEFIELIALTGHRDEVWKLALNTIGETHVPTEHWEFAGTEVDRFKRKATVSTVPKSEACKNWQGGCDYWESWAPPAR